MSAGAPSGVAGSGTNGPDRAAEPDGLRRLRALLREQGGLLATLLRAYDDDDERGGGNGDGAGEGVADTCERPSPAEVAAEGPRAEGRREEYELLIEAIYEG